jgi:type IV secretion system protein VirD4
MLGRLNRRRLVAGEARRSVLVVAPTQAGKTTRFVVRNVLCWTGPLLVTSVKGDVLRLTAAERTRRGGVHVFDPTGSAGVTSCRWSPLLACATYADAERVAGWLVTAAGESHTDANVRFWEQLGAKLLGSLLFAAAGTGSRISQVARWVDRREVQEVADALKKLGDADAIDAFTASQSREDRQRDSVYATAETVLRSFTSPSVRAATDVTINDAHVLDIECMLDRAETLYLVAPAHEQSRLRPLFESLAQSVVRAAQDRYAATGAPLDPPLLLMLDEAAHIAPIRDLGALAATGAGQGIQLCTIWQDLAQIETVYGRSATSVVNGHTARVLLAGSADLSTLDATSRAIGDHETVRTSTSTGADGQRSVSRSEGEGRLAPVEYLRQLPPDTAVVLYGRLPPIRVRTTPWWSDRSLRAMVEAPDAPVTPTACSPGARPSPAGTTPSPAIRPIGDSGAQPPINPADADLGADTPSNVVALPGHSTWTGPEVSSAAEREGEEPLTHVRELVENLSAIVTEQMDTLDALRVQLRRRP